jgi:1-aminocyclopropane-1-carboxylate deaminase/D-cysteine desulfhydrase-like pyridoxal-dependent ACC family enzyme
MELFALPEDDSFLILSKDASARPTTVLFWHTGGAPALFAYAKDLV